MEKTYEFATSFGNKVVLNNFLSAEEHFKLKTYVERRMKGQVIGSDATMDFDGEMIVERQKELLKAYIVAWNGQTEDVFNKFMKFASGQEFEEVLEQIENNDATAKKEQSTPETSTETS